MLFFLLIGCGKKREPEQSQNELKIEVGGFYYVGGSDSRSGLYYYDLHSGKSDSVWTGKKETIIDYTRNESANTGCLITVSDYGKLGVFPFVKNVRLYFINLKTHEIAASKNFGGGLQVCAFWQDDKSVKLIMNVMDPTTASYVEQKSFLVSSEGKLLFEDKKTYDFTKDGFPGLPVAQPNLISPNRKYRVVAYENNEIAIPLNGPKPVTIFQPSSFKPRQVEWTKDHNYAVVSVCNVLPENETLYDKKPKTSALSVFNISKEKIDFTESGSGYHNFEILGDYLIFDTGFAENSTIKIYQFSLGKVIGEIKSPAGAGIRNIPQIPDYDA